MEHETVDQLLRKSMRSALKASMTMFMDQPDNMVARSQFSGAMTCVASILADFHAKGMIPDTDKFLAEVFAPPLDSMEEIFRIALSRFYGLHSREKDNVDE